MSLRLSVSIHYVLLLEGIISSNEIGFCTNMFTSILLSPKTTRDDSNPIGIALICFQITLAYLIWSLQHINIAGKKYWRKIGAISEKCLRSQSWWEIEFRLEPRSVVPGLVPFSTPIMLSGWGMRPLSMKWWSFTDWIFYCVM